MEGNPGRLMEGMKWFLKELRVLSDGKDCSHSMFHAYNSNLQNDNEQWINEKCAASLAMGKCKVK